MADTGCPNDQSDEFFMKLASLTDSYERKLKEIQNTLNETLKEKALLQVDLENVRIENSVLAFKYNQTKEKLQETTKKLTEYSEEISNLKKEEKLWMGEYTKCLDLVKSTAEELAQSEILPD